jgi:hypothetical protein
MSAAIVDKGGTDHKLYDEYFRLPALRSLDGDCHRYYQKGACAQKHCPYIHWFINIKLFFEEFEASPPPLPPPYEGGSDASDDLSLVIVEHDEVAGPIDMWQPIVELLSIEYEIDDVARFHHPGNYGDHAPEEGDYIIHPNLAWGAMDAPVPDHIGSKGKIQFVNHGWITFEKRPHGPGRSEYIYTQNLGWEYPGKRVIGFDFDAEYIDSRDITRFILPPNLMRQGKWAIWKMSRYSSQYGSFQDPMVYDTIAIRMEELNKSRAARWFYQALPTKKTTKSKLRKFVVNLEIAHSYVTRLKADRTSERNYKTINTVIGAQYQARCGLAMSIPAYQIARNTGCGSIAAVLQTHVETCRGDIDAPQTVIGRIQQTADYIWSAMCTDDAFSLARFTFCARIARDYEIKTRTTPNVEILGIIAQRTTVVQSQLIKFAGLGFATGAGIAAVMLQPIDASILGRFFPLLAPVGGCLEALTTIGTLELMKGPLSTLTSPAARPLISYLGVALKTIVEFLCGAHLIHLPFIGMIHALELRLVNKGFRAIPIFLHTLFDIPFVPCKVVALILFCAVNLLGEEKMNRLIYADQQYCDSASKMFSYLIEIIVSLRVERATLDETLPIIRGNTRTENFRYSSCTQHIGVACAQPLKEEVGADMEAVDFTLSMYHTLYHATLEPTRIPDRIHRISFNCMKRKLPGGAVPDPLMICMDDIEEVFPPDKIIRQHVIGPHRPLTYKLAVGRLNMCVNRLFSFKPMSALDQAENAYTAIQGQLTHSNFWCDTLHVTKTNSRALLRYLPDTASVKWLKTNVGSYEVVSFLRIRVHYLLGQRFYDTKELIWEEIWDTWRQHQQDGPQKLAYYTEYMARRYPELLEDLNLTTGGPNWHRLLETRQRIVTNYFTKKENVTCRFKERKLFGAHAASLTSCPEFTIPDEEYTKNRGIANCDPFYQLALGPYVYTCYKRMSFLFPPVFSTPHFVWSRPGEEYHHSSKGTPLSVYVGDRNQKSSIPIYWTFGPGLTQLQKDLWLRSIVTLRRTMTCFMAIMTGGDDTIIFWKCGTIEIWICSDFSSFDQCQQAAVLLAECDHLRALGVPEGALKMKMHMHGAPKRIPLEDRDFSQPNVPAAVELTGFEPIRGSGESDTAYNNSVNAVKPVLNALAMCAVWEQDVFVEALKETFTRMGYKAIIFVGGLESATYHKHRILPDTDGGWRFVPVDTIMSKIFYTKRSSQDLVQLTTRIRARPSAPPDLRADEAWMASILYGWSSFNLSPNFRDLVESWTPLVSRDDAFFILSKTKGYHQYRKLVDVSGVNCIPHVAFKHPILQAQALDFWGSALHGFVRTANFDRSIAHAMDQERYAALAELSGFQSPVIPIDALLRTLHHSKFGDNFDFTALATFQSLDCVL